MHNLNPAPLVAVFLGLFVCGNAHAQTIAASFDDLLRVLSVGDFVIVIDKTVRQRGAG
jgi:hypothetical protein